MLFFMSSKCYALFIYLKHLNRIYPEDVEYDAGCLDVISPVQ